MSCAHYCTVSVNGYLMPRVRSMVFSSDTERAQCVKLVEDCYIRVRPLAKPDQGYLYANVRPRCISRAWEARLDTSSD